MDIKLPDYKKYTEEQEQILDIVVKSMFNMMVRARAGTGKTFLLKIIATLFPNKKMLYVTFSKELANEALAANLPKNMDVKTAHGLSYSAAKKFYCPAGQMSCSPWHREDALMDYLDEPAFVFDPLTDKDEEDGVNIQNIKNEARKTMLQLVSYCKVNMVDPKNREAVDEVIKYYQIPAEPVHLRHLAACFEFSKKPSKNIDYNEMVHTPVMLGLPLPKYDIILADEIQDSSLMLMELYKMCLAAGGFILGVGDDFQAIYGFAGSRNEGMDIFAEKFNVHQEPLSVNFRCGTEHIKLAQTIVPDIKAHDNAIEGSVRVLDEVDFDKAQPGDMFISRVNRNLVGPCLSLVRQGKKANIKGKDIAAPINAILKKLKAMGLTKNAALDALQKMLGQELKLAERRKYKQTSIDLIVDRYGIAEDFLMDAETVDDAIKRLYTIFADETPGIVFCSVHKSKGLEADKVTILEYDKIRMVRDDMTPWQHEQEAHLHYVAVTRPRKELDLIIPKKEA